MPEFEVVVEWGSGYGNLIKLLLRLHAGEPTCVLVDTPVFSSIQWLYLSAILGGDRVVMHHGRPREVVRGKSTWCR